MKRKMYELIIPNNQLPVFWIDNDEKILRQLSDPKAIADQYANIERNSWSPKNGWISEKGKYNSIKLTFPLISVNSEDLVAYVKEQIPEMEKSYSNQTGNYIIAHRQVGNIVHVGMSIFDAITERPINWID